MVPFDEDFRVKEALWREIHEYYTSKRKERNVLSLIRRLLMIASNCPICNSPDRIIYCTSSAFPQDFGYYVMCNDCGNTTAIYKKRNQAIGAWNRGEVKHKCFGSE